jgi:hypothetical protein
MRRSSSERISSAVASESDFDIFSEYDFEKFTPILIRLPRPKVRKISSVLIKQLFALDRQVIISLINIFLFQRFSSRSSAKCPPPSISLSSLLLQQFALVHIIELKHQ